MTASVYRFLASSLKPMIRKNPAIIAMMTPAETHKPRQTSWIWNSTLSTSGGITLVAAITATLPSDAADTGSIGSSMIAGTAARPADSNLIACLRRRTDFTSLPWVKFLTTSTTFGGISILTGRGSMDTLNPLAVADIMLITFRMVWLLECYVDICSSYSIPCCKIFIANVFICNIGGVSIMRLGSNLAVGMQGLFAGARQRTSSAIQGFKKIMSEPAGKPYSKMTRDERMAHDVDMWEIDPVALDKQHKKMVKRYGEDYASKLHDDDLEISVGSSKGLKWW